MRLLLIPLLSVALSACGFVGFPGVYKINVEQGNVVSREVADLLKPGMSRRQVRFILGTPLLEDPFNQDRWDYKYVKSNAGTVLEEKHMMVFFDGDILVNVSGDYVPDWARQNSPGTPAGTSADNPPADSLTSS